MNSNRKAIKKVLIPALAVSLLSTSLVSASALDRETKIQYAGKGVNTYEVSVPAKLGPGESGQVKLNGTWSTVTTIEVKTDNTVELVNSIDNGTKVLDVNFNGIKSIGDNEYPMELTETISVGQISEALFGTWSGNIVYTITMQTEDRFTNIIEQTDTIMSDTLYTSEQAATAYFLENVFDYSSFGILVQDLSMLHTVTEYKQICPALINLEIDNITHYQNGYNIQFKNVKVSNIDPKLVYAIKTGDTSILNTDEQITYNKVINELPSELNLSNLSDIDKVKAIHDYLVLNVAYDEAEANSSSIIREASYKAEGALINRLAVCQGYASAFNLMCLSQGIESEYVWSESGNHGWNLVKIDGKWYHIDVTWDDPVPDVEGRVLYNYFMMTSTEVNELEQHKDWQCDCGKTHDANYDNYRLYPYNDYICENESEMLEVIRNQANSNQVIIVYKNSLGLEDTAILTKIATELGLTGNISYKPSTNLGLNHKILIINK